MIHELKPYCNWTFATAEDKRKALTAIVHIEPKCHGCCRDIQSTSGRTKLIVLNYNIIEQEKMYCMSQRDLNTAACYPQEPSYLFYVTDFLYICNQCHQQTMDDKKDEIVSEALKSMKNSDDRCGSEDFVGRHSDFTPDDSIIDEDFIDIFDKFGTIERGRAVGDAQYVMNRLLGHKCPKKLPWKIINRDNLIDLFHKVKCDAPPFTIEEIDPPYDFNSLFLQRHNGLANIYLLLNITWNVVHKEQLENEKCNKIFNRKRFMQPLAFDPTDKKNRNKLKKIKKKKNTGFS